MIMLLLYRLVYIVIQLEDSFVTLMEDKTVQLDGNNST